MKMFLAGLLSGAALFAAGNALLNGNDSAAVFDLDGTQAPAADRNTIVSAENHTPPTSPRTLGANEQRPSEDCISIDDSNLEKAIFTLSDRLRAREQANYESEPRDPLWSDAMEQQLREAFARHQRSKAFVLTKVDCRTLYCEVNAEGPARAATGGEGASDAFAAAILDIAKEFGLRRGAGGSQSDGGVAKSREVLRRFKPGDECPPGFQRDCWNR